MGGAFLTRTGRVSEIVRVNDRIVHRVRGVDVDPAVAVRVLERSGDTDVTVSITVHEQDLDLTDRAGEDLGGRRVVNRLVTRNDALVVSRVRRVPVHRSQDALLRTGNVGAVEPGGVHIGNAIIDVREIESIILENNS